MKQQCSLCRAKETNSWWKCCPEHVSERGPDVVCQQCAKDCQENNKNIILYELNDPHIVHRLIKGDWSFGCHGTHRGNGSKDCPFDRHHHHDQYCKRPTNAELIAAGINPKEFRAKSRG